MSLWHAYNDGILSAFMEKEQSVAPAGASSGKPAAAPAGAFVKVTALLLVATCLILWASPPIALVAGILFALLIGHPFAHLNHKIAKWLLQTCVVLLGFGMNLPVVLHLGMDGSLFAAATIGTTLTLGWWLGKTMKLDSRTTALVSVGTAICGGSAIAAVSSVIAATEAQIAVSIGTVFMLNAVALYLFPMLGHLLHLSQTQFGLWAGVAIHDISSVVGAGLSYGTGALNTATAVKLSRSLWIVPLTVAVAFGVGQRARRRGNAHLENGHRKPKAKIAIPWFIGLFLLASLMRSYIPVIREWSPDISKVADRGMVAVLFLIGASLSLRALRTVGWRTVTVGLALWAFISVTSLFAILFFKLGA